jgi:hypothetical protein
MARNGALSDWVTQQWVKLTGRRIALAAHTWVDGPKPGDWWCGRRDRPGGCSPTSISWRGQDLSPAAWTLTYGFLRTDFRLRARGLGRVVWRLPAVRPGARRDLQPPAPATQRPSRLPRHCARHLRARHDREHPGLSRGRRRSAGRPHDVVRGADLHAAALPTSPPSRRGGKSGSLSERRMILLSSGRSLLGLAGTRRGECDHDRRGRRGRLLVASAGARHAGLAGSPGGDSGALGDGRRIPLRRGGYPARRRAGPGFSSRGPGARSEPIRPGRRYYVSSTSDRMA